MGDGEIVEETQEVVVVHLEVTDPTTVVLELSDHDTSAISVTVNMWNSSLITA